MSFTARILILIFSSSLLYSCSEVVEDASKLPPNNPPTFVDFPSAVDIEENMKHVIALVAYDPDDDNLSYSVSLVDGNAEKQLFEINGSSLEFIIPPDYETPGSKESSNIYQTTVFVTDGKDTVGHDLVVSVTDVGINYQKLTYNRYLKTLTVTPDIKKISVSWNRDPEAAGYFLEMLDFWKINTQVFDISQTTTDYVFDLSVHRTEWSNFQINVFSCAQNPCENKDYVPFSDDIVTVRPLQTGYFKSPNTDINDYFGHQVVVSGNGKTLVVGAPFEDSSAIGINSENINNVPLGSTSITCEMTNSSLCFDSGAVYVYTVDSSNYWYNPPVYIKPSNTDQNDLFGSAIAISNDGQTMAIGAPHEDGNGLNPGGGNQTNSNNNLDFNAGAVYIFVRETNGDWKQQEYIKASNTDSSDLFGSAVSMSADGNTLAVGAPLEDGNDIMPGGNGIQDNDPNAGLSYDAGAVYIYSREAGVWTHKAYIKAFNTDALDHFGFALSLSNDGQVLAVGAPGEDSDATGINGVETNSMQIPYDAGAVYIFSSNATKDIWGRVAYIKATNTDKGDKFGNSLSLSGDGKSLAVGAPYEDSEATGVNAPDSVNQTNSLLYSNYDSGAVYSYSNISMTTIPKWVQTAYIKAENANNRPLTTGPVVDGLPTPSSQGENYGSAVAISADGSTLVVGTPYENTAVAGISVGSGAADTVNDCDSKLSNYNCSLSSGAIFLYSHTPSTSTPPWVYTTYIKSPNNDPNDHFGGSVSLNSDGSTHAVGASGESSNATGASISGQPNQTDNSRPSAGAVYLY